nr:hypothetical protein CFP56_52065 [Quercus suber]
MEVNLSVDRGERKGRTIALVRPNMGRSIEPMVAVPHECAIIRGRVTTELGVQTSNLTNSTTLRSESYGVPNGAKNARLYTNFHLSHGEQPHHQANPSFLANCGVQPPCVLTRNGDGSVAAQLDDVSWGGADEGNADVDGMELEGGSKISASF